MIEINLLPEEQKVKIIKSSAAAEKYIYVVYVLAFIIIVVSLLNIFFLINGLLLKSRAKALEKEWVKISAQMDNLKSLKQGTQGLSEENRLLQELLMRRLNLAQKLNSLSLNLAKGMWIRELYFSISKKSFLIQGSAVSLVKEELRVINKFITDLKSDSEFFQYFQSLELTSVTRDSLGSTDIMNFVLTGKLK